MTAKILQFQNGTGNSGIDGDRVNGEYIPGSESERREKEIYNFETWAGMPYGTLKKYPEHNKNGE